MKENNLLLNFLILILPISRTDAQCYAENASPYLYFSSKTSYLVGHGSQMNVPAGYEPVYLWGLIRHGTRYAEIEIINSLSKLYSLRNEIILNHKNGRGTLCEKDLMNLKNWSTNMATDNITELDLTPQGVKDQIFLAQRMKKKFPKLLQSGTKDNFKFQSSGQSRAKKSAITFTNELLGTNFTSIEGNNITEDDEFLQLSDHCPRYIKEVEHNPSTYTEVNLFMQSAYFQKIIAEISLRLGYLQPLSFDNIQLLHDVCAYENAWYIGSKPPFCAVFSQHELEAMDYLWDMNKYHSRGYGNPFVNRIGCPLVRDMVTSLLNAKIKFPNANKGKFLFSHSEAIVPVTAKLNLNKDEEPLRHDNYQKMIKNRKWRLALFDSFAANIIAILYKCSSQTQNCTQTKVAIYQNERPVVFSQCNNSELCNLETLQQMYPDVFDENECSSKFCQLSDLQKVSSRCSTLSNFSIVTIIFSIIHFLC